MKKVTICDAGNMSDETYNCICDKLLHILADGEEVEFVRQHDKSLIGGFIVTSNDKRYDASLRYRLEQMREHVQSKE